MRFDRLYVPLLFVLGTSAATAQSSSPVKQAPVKPASRASLNVPPSSVPTFLASAGEDDCANASLSAISGTGTFPVNTTTSTDSPQIGTGCVQPHLDVWFQYTATYTGAVELSLCGATTTDTVVAVWTGTACPVGAALACNDDQCGLQSMLTFPVTNGNQYLIQIGVFGSSAGFASTFTLTQPPPPPMNDNCASALAVVGLGTFPFDNTMATTGPEGQTEGACLFFGSTAMDSDVWFTWTAPATGLASLSTCTLTFVDTKIAAYPGAGCPAAGSVLACNDDNCASLQSSIDFPVTMGSVYTFQIGSFPGSTGGTGSFLIDIPPPPPTPTPASIYVDLGSPSTGFGTPSSAYAAAAGTPGFWNSRSVAVSSSQLNDLGNVPCGAVLTRTGTSLADFAFDNIGTTGDDQALLDDAQDIGAAGGTTTWTFSNLFGGDYRVYTYAWAPDNATFLSSVSVAGSLDPAQTVGGTWSGAHMSGLTYAVHNVTGIPNTGSIDITVTTNSGFGTLNGFQVVRMNSTFTSYCFGDGTGAACPCANNGAAGNGCANSVVAAGGNLTASGFASVASDSVVLTGTGMPNSSCLYFQGTTQIAAAFGDGIRCVGGTVIRLGTKANSGGMSQYPAPGDPSVSVRGLIPMAGGTREYQCWYRNAAAFCTSATFNLTNGVEIPWQM